MIVENCTIESNKYPKGLKNINDKPSILYYNGSIECINKYKNIAVIGTRKASENGLKIAYETGAFLAKNNINVVNGLALGCDTEALRGALDNGGRCIVLLPCGLDNIQPKSNRSLADRIVQNGGCLISEYNVGTPLNKYQYVKRDRLQSGICQGVLVVEAEMNSGTMHTVKYADEQFKRIACYSHRLVKCSSGNEYIEQSKNVSVLSNTQQLEEFIQNINSELTYTQLTLF